MYHSIQGSGGYPPPPPPGHPPPGGQSGYPGSGQGQYGQYPPPPPGRPPGHASPYGQPPPPPGAPPGHGSYPPPGAPPPPSHGSPYGHPQPPPGAPPRGQASPYGHPASPFHHASQTGYGQYPPSPLPGDPPGASAYGQPPPPPPGGQYGQSPYPAQPQTSGYPSPHHSGQYPGSYSHGATPGGGYGAPPSPYGAPASHLPPGMTSPSGMNTANSSHMGSQAYGSPAPFNPNAVSTSQLEVRVACSNLPSYDLTSKSDPAVTLYHRDHPDHPWTLIGHTETLSNKTNPQFLTPFNIPFHFSKNSFLRFIVLDIDEKTADMTAQDFIGFVDVSVSAVARQGSVTMGLMNHDPPGMKTGMMRLRRVNNPGNITISGVEVANQKDMITMGIQCRDLEKKDTFSSDPFIVIQRQDRNGGWTAVHRLKVQTKTCNPMWQPFELSFAALTGGNMNTRLQFTVMDWDKTSKSDLIGNAESTLQDITNAVRDHGSYNLTLINPQKAGKRFYKDSGKLTVYQCNVQRGFTFVDFVSTGTEICLTVAIDFGASKQGITNASSSPSQKYEQAITQVGRILESYDSDKRFPCYGFGGVFHGTHTVSSCHPLTGNAQQPEVYGIHDLIDLYRRSAAHVKPAGPSQITPVIRQVMDRARYDHVDPHARLLRKYSILLIVTEGNVHDLSAAQQAIREASHCAMSIIIVGVGDNDFTKMEQLDADQRGDMSTHQNMPTAGHTGERHDTAGVRDVVQFVPLNRALALGPEKLAYDTLAEIPAQITKFALTNGLKPGGH